MYIYIHYIIYIYMYIDNVYNYIIYYNIYIYIYIYTTYMYVAIEYGKYSLWRHPETQPPRSTTIALRVATCFSVFLSSSGKGQTASALDPWLSLKESNWSRGGSCICHSSVPSGWEDDLDFVGGRLSWCSLLSTTWPTLQEIFLNMNFIN